MVDQLFSESEPIQEVAVISKIDGNNPSSSTTNQRRRKLSGPDSQGKKWLLKENPIWLLSPKVKTPVFNSCLCSLDEVVATPSFNISVIESACNQDFKFFDAINKSKYMPYIDSALIGLGLFAISIGIYVVKYCKLREIERNSNYFYFSRLFKTCNAEEIKNKMGEIIQDNDSTDNLITYEYLQAAAYFYPPDISKIACWRRRFFASGKEKAQLKALNNFLKKNSKKEMLNKLHKKITEQVCQLLNKTQANKFKTDSYGNSEIITLSDAYSVKFFDHVEGLINHNAKTTFKKNNDKKNKTYVPSILAAFGQASFIYWILMFIFYFIPIAPVVTTALISLIPLAAALCGALPLLLIFKLKKVDQEYDANKKMSEADIKKQHVHMLEKKLVALNKQNVFLSHLQNKDANSKTIKLKDSPLMKDLDKVLKRRRFSKYHAIGVGFLDGCFLPLFAGWLLLDGIKVILTYALCPTVVPLTSFTPIGLVATAVIAGVTLLIGISYGIYSAYKANQVHEAKFDDLQVKIKALQDEVPTKEVLNKSLRDYDRILRRFSTEQPLWTNVKKGLSRLILVIKRLGTGSLVFRLVIWAPITAAVAASTTVLPLFFPIILIVGTAISAFVLASCYLYAYNLESKTTQAGRIVEYLVQSEQLDCIDKQLSAPVPARALNIPEPTSENLIVVPENMADCKNDNSTERLHENSSPAAESSHSAETCAMTTQHETGTQRNTGNPSSKGLFIKNSHCMNENNEKNLGDCLSPVVLSC
jgi:hypothetical protein